jgi:transcriptional regulator with PAS, ATPase and Fis domain
MHPSAEEAFSPESVGLLGRSDSMQRVNELIQRIAQSDSTVLVTGETGTGKELAAQAIHRLSPRHKNAFVCVNCTAIPDTLLESELFGFEKGAFTGAAARQDGKLKQANHGTVFLDEIGDMSSLAQAKVLRAIESREIQPLGGTAAVNVDLRIVAATHRDLELLVNEQKFRNDLFFRLNVVPLRMPALRERREDIAVLVQHFIQELNVRYGRRVDGVTPAGIRMLTNHEWPGNVRQLRNIVEGAFVVCNSSWITTSDLRWLHWSAGPAVEHVPAVPEPDRLLTALQATRWNKSKTAQLLRWSRMTVYRKIAKYQLTENGDNSLGTAV